MQSKISLALINNGYFKFKINKKKFSEINKLFIKHVSKSLDEKKPNLENTHLKLSIKHLNQTRLKIFRNINKDKKFKSFLYNSVSKYIDMCVGSEIVGSDVNLSIQYPNDNSSLLSMHSDFFSGESLFQINLWIPFVNVKKTQSMFIVNPLNSMSILKKIKNDKNLCFSNIDDKYKKYMKWINLKKGEGLLFSPNCLHGNVVNMEKKTRWSINIRYKNLFSPYSELKENEKKIGIFYDIFTAKLITKFNLKYDFKQITR